VQGYRPGKPLVQRRWSGESAEGPWKAAPANPDARPRPAQPNQSRSTVKKLQVAALLLGSACLLAAGPPEKFSKAGEKTTEAAGTAKKKTVRGVEKAGEATEKGVKTATDATTEGVGKAMGATSEAVGEAKQKTVHGAKKAKKSTVKTAEVTKEKTVEGARKTMEARTETVETVGKKTKEGAQAVGAGFKKLGKKTQQAVTSVKK